MAKNMTNMNNMGGQVMNCTCSAYPFPHRPLGGACEAEAIWRGVEEEGWECGECPHADHHVEKSEFWGAVRWDRWRECRAQSAAQCPGIALAIGREVAA